MQIPQELEKFVSQHNIPVYTSDRKFYKKFCYKLCINYYTGNFVFRYAEDRLQIWCDLFDHIKEWENETWQIRRESSKFTLFTSEIDKLQQIYELALEKVKQEHTQYLDFSIYYIASNVKSNIRLRKDRLPYNKYPYEIVLKPKSVHKLIKNFVENYGDVYKPNKSLCSAMNNERYFYGDRCSLYAESQDYVSLFALSYGEGIREIINYQLMETGNE